MKHSSDFECLDDTDDIQEQRPASMLLWKTMLRVPAGENIYKTGGGWGWWAFMPWQESLSKFGGGKQGYKFLVKRPSHIWNLFSGIIVTDVGNDLAEKLFPETMHAKSLMLTVKEAWKTLSM